MPAEPARPALFTHPLVENRLKRVSISSRYFTYTYSDSDLDVSPYASYSQKLDRQSLSTLQASSTHPNLSAWYYRINRIRGACQYPQTTWHSLSGSDASHLLSHQLEILPSLQPAATIIAKFPEVRVSSCEPFSREKQKGASDIGLNIAFGSRSRSLPVASRGGSPSASIPRGGQSGQQIS